LNPAIIYESVISLRSAKVVIEKRQI